MSEIYFLCCQRSSCCVLELCFRSEDQCCGSQVPQMPTHRAAVRVNWGSKDGGGADLESVYAELLSSIGTHHTMLLVPLRQQCNLICHAFRLCSVFVSRKWNKHEHITQRLYAGFSSHFCLSCRFLQHLRFYVVRLRKLLAIAMPVLEPRSANALRYLWDL